jgi:hypothetical protein
MSDTADTLDDLAGAIDALSQASMLDNGTRRRAQPLDAILDAKTACLSAIGRVVEQMHADLDREDREDAAALKGDVHATGDVHGEARSLDGEDPHAVARYAMHMRAR